MKVLDCFYTFMSKMLDVQEFVSLLSLQPVREFVRWLRARSLQKNVHK